MTNKNGFILIEIIISVILLSVVGTALLKINSNEKSLFKIASIKLEFTRYISILANRHSINLHNKEINLYDFIKKEYDIKDEALIKTLKNSKLDYKQKYKSIVNFQTDDKKNSIDLLIDEIKISDKLGTSNFITIRR